MPAVTLYGRRWHFSSDIVAVPALLSAFFHAAWVLILVVWGASSGWPGRCDSSDGVAYVILFSGMLASFALNLVIDLLLTYHSLQGGPFEVSKRRWVAPLLYAATLPLVAQLGFTLYGTHVSTRLQPDCWHQDKRNAVTNIAQGLVFSTWGFVAVASLGIAITYNMYPEHHDLSSWEARCDCIASTLCCHKNVTRRPDGKRPPLTNIAELTAGLLSHCDLDATDITAALFLASAAQNRRRRLWVAKALLPVYKALKSGGGATGLAGSPRGAVRRQGRLPASGLEAGYGEEDATSDDDEAATSDASSSTSLNEVPNDRELDRMITEQQAQQAAQQAVRQAQPVTPQGAQQAAQQAQQAEQQTQEAQEVAGHAMQAAQQEVRQGARQVAQQGEVEAGLEPARAPPHPGDGALPEGSQEKASVGWRVGQPRQQQRQQQGRLTMGPRGRAKTVSWAEERLWSAALAAPAGGQGPAFSPEAATPCGPAGTAPSALLLAEEGQAAQKVPGDEAAMPAMSANSGAAASHSTGAAPPPSAELPAAELPPAQEGEDGAGGGTVQAAPAGASLLLTEQTVAMLDQQLAATEAGGTSSSPTASSPSPTDAKEVEAAAASLAGELMQELPEHMPSSVQDGVVGQLADAIEEEIRQLGGGQLPDEAVLEMTKEESLDLSALEIDPEAPSIWFSTAGSSHRGGLSTSGSRLGDGETSAEAAARDGLAAAGAEEEEGVEEEGERVREGQVGASQGDAGSGSRAVRENYLSAQSPFYTAGGGGSRAHQQGSVPGAAASGAGDGGVSEGVPHAAKVEAAAAAALPSVREGDETSSSKGQQQQQQEQPAAPPDGEAIPPADEAAAAAVAEAAAVAAAAAAAQASPRSPRSESHRSGQSGAASSAAGHTAASSAGTARLDIRKQLTVRYPVVITPSEHVEDFRGPLPAAALADIYAGRHEKVPSMVLLEAIHFLKFSYAVYSLQPKVEAPSSGLDILACCTTKVPDPTQVVFRGLSELEALEDDSAIELLHLNCSNRVLAHLPYMICLDHGKRAVVLAIRGTIGAADIVTDAIVYPESLDTWLPPDIKEELTEPAFAHAGMVAAARAIFEDMTERGILQQLVEEEAVGDYTAPPGQQAQRGNGSSSGGSSGGGERWEAGEQPAGVPAGRQQYGQESQYNAGQQRYRPESQYDADSGMSGPWASRYWLNGGGRGRGKASGSGSGQRSDSPGRGVPAGRGGPGGTNGGPAAEPAAPAGGSSEANRQSSQRGDAAGRLWEGTSGGAAKSDTGGPTMGPGNGRQQQQGAQQQGAGRHPGKGQARGFHHHSMHQQQRGRGGAAAKAGEGGLQASADESEASPGRRVGEIMRQKIQEGWQMIVEGHSLGAGTAALVSLKLRAHFPGLKCIAYSCPGGLVSKNLAHAMAPFTTTVVVGKDAVCRATVGNLARLMDEMVTALARCKKPKLAVLFWPWWRRRKAHFRQLFWDYDQIPQESLEVLHRYYESRSRIGQPLSMYPPGRIIFLRPIKTRVAKDWDAVWIQPEDIIAEGLLVSPHALRDHLCSTAFEALSAATARMEALESDRTQGPLSGQADARPHGSHGRARKAARRAAQRQAAAAARRRVRRRLEAQGSSSLQDVLIEAA